MCEEDFSWNPSPCICDNAKYLKSIADASVIVCDKIINAIDRVHQQMRKILYQQILYQQMSWVLSQ